LIFLHTDSPDFSRQHPYKPPPAALAQTRIAVNQCACGDGANTNEINRAGRIASSIQAW
jgi:hypothetical protein